MKAFEEINNQTLRKQFKKDLAADISSIQALGHEIIVLGDLNDTMHSKKSFPRELMRKFQLIDGWEHMNLSQPEPATYFQGKHRIDHCLCTPEISKALQSVKYTPFFTITRSDHLAIVIDLDTDTLFKKRAQIQSFHKRGILSNNYKQLPVYIEKVHDHLNKNKVFTKMEHLHNDPALNSPSIEDIDNLISQACQSGEKTVKKRHRAWWSIEIHQTRYCLNIVNKAISQSKKRHYNQLALQLQLDQHQCLVELPKTLTDLIQLKKEVREQLQDHLDNAREKRDEYLSRHIQTASTEVHTEQARITKSIRHAEQVNQAYKTMASI